MIVEIPYSVIISFFWNVFTITWVLTFVRTMWGRYRDERCWNSGVCLVFCNSLMAATVIFTKLLNPDAISIRIALPNISEENSLMYVVSTVGAVAWFFRGIIIPLYRTFIESDEAKDKRFGIVPIQEN